MRVAVSHPWDLQIGEAKALQAQLAQQVVRNTAFSPSDVRCVAGVDVGFQGNLARAAVVVLSFPDLELVDLASAQVPVTFPYVPGLLAFREGPGVLQALEKLATWPDLFIFDAHGIAHPRRLGLAAHMGVVLDTPSIGCAKSRLIGQHADPSHTAGAWTHLCDDGEIIGAAVRTEPGSQPIYVSIGHRIDLPTAVEFVLRCCRGHRVPETTLHAHRLASGAKLTVKPQQLSLC